MTYIGIDPGKSGAVAVVGPDRHIELLLPFDEQKARDALYWAAEDGRPVCCLERVGAHPGQGVTSMFTFGTNYGFWQGLLAAFEIPFQLVTPSVWKKAMGVTKDKNTSIEVCQRLFPQADLRRTPRSVKPDDGLAEALLLAEYARRTFGTGTQKEE